MKEAVFVDVFVRNDIGMEGRLTVPGSQIDFSKTKISSHTVISAPQAVEAGYNLSEVITQEGERFFSPKESMKIRASVLGIDRVYENSGLQFGIKTPEFIAAENKFGTAMAEDLVGRKYDMLSRADLIRLSDDVSKSPLATRHLSA